MKGRGTVGGGGVALSHVMIICFQWSYGVTLWEVMTLAKLPYGDQIDHNRGVLTHLLMQNRLLQPEDCPDNM